MSSSPPSSERTDLASLLALTAAILLRVRNGESLSQILPQQAAPLRPALQALSFYVMRYLGRAQALRQILLSKKAPNPKVAALLDVSLCLLSASDYLALEKNDPAYAQVNHEWAQQRVPAYDDFTIVNQAVEATQAHKKTAAFKGLINACLRRYLREKQRLLATLWQQEEVKFAFPQWWIAQIKEDYPQQWQQILIQSNQAGPLWLRVNQRLISVTKFCQHLQAAHIAHLAFDDVAVLILKATPLADLPGFQEGWFAVQDWAAQQVNQILPLRNGQRVLDACAAPGGKTAHLLEQYELDLWALDRDAQRLQRIQENLQRLHLLPEQNPNLGQTRVRVQVADATHAQAWFEGPAFDAILADVPCTGTGVVRRHPDMKWLRRPSDIQQTVALQRQIVSALWPTLAVGGRLLYMTCSVLAQEGEAQAHYFSQHLVGAKRLEAPGQLLPGQDQWLGKPPASLAPEVSHDGFFYALFEKVN
ncbi:16S rRNA (cytosine(967)-C(5))-methyltransferase RsmB [Brackiella oedipodis]|uniref:16S rRNA (cytosine(967)-C(5))-methyltransferase RsmB n=1 Tax=Brackiella oedipodis TaxID=124225 RepID=UPI0005707FC0|nr:16S rRNA (cytosine(967)-C(5))-methyltransferase RsmB [Brackiella oedipodis]